MKEVQCGSKTTKINFKKFVLKKRTKNCKIAPFSLTLTLEQKNRSGTPEILNYNKINYNNNKYKYNKYNNNKTPVIINILAILCPIRVTLMRIKKICLL